MFGRKKPNTARVDGGEGRGNPLDGHDDRPPTGSRNDEDELDEITDRDFGWDEGDPADRRRDPLRKP